MDIEQLRRRAFSIAYRMLGTVSEAEDIVQEALLRVHQTPQLDNPQAFITTVTTRLAITELQSARVRRESYVGDWLPEPVLTADDPSVLAESSEAVSLALLTALETLTPPQRAALLLHDVFDYDYSQIAAVLDVTAANARQLVTRARRLVSAGPRFTPERGQHAELVQRFLAAAERGDLAGLEQLLADDVLMRGDGGGKVPALGRTVAGRARVAKTLVNGVRAFASMPGLTWRAAEVNGAPGAVYVDGSGALIAVLALEVADGRVVSVDSVANPDKLRHLGAVGDVHALLQAAHPRGGAVPR